MACKYSNFRSGEAFDVGNTSPSSVFWVLTACLTFLQSLFCACEGPGLQISISPGRYERSEDSHRFFLPLRKGIFPSFPGRLRPDKLGCLFQGHMAFGMDLEWYSGSDCEHEGPDVIQGPVLVLFILVVGKIDALPMTACGDSKSGAPPLPEGVCNNLDGPL